MKILELHVEGFRSLKNVTWRPGDLNVVIGPNASGKSNLLKLLDMMSIAAEGRLSRYFSTLGGFRSQLWNERGLRESIAIGVRMNSASAVDKTLGTIQGDSYFMRLAPTAAGGYRFVREIIGRRDGPDEITVFFERRDRQFWLDVNGERQGVASANIMLDVELRDDETLLSRYRANPHWLDESLVHSTDPSSLDARFAEEELLSQFSENPITTSGVLTTYRTDLASTAVYQWFDTSPNAKVRVGVPLRHEIVLDSDGQNLASLFSTLYNEREFRDDIDTAMLAAFGRSYVRVGFQTVQGGNVVLNIQWEELDKPTPAWDLSDGTLRYLYLLAILCNPNSASLVAIDEPEIGLHPDMLPIIAEFAVEASNRSQVIFTTHSVQLLDAFKVTDTTPTVTVALCENGQTMLTTLEQDELNPWLERYSLGALFNSGTLEAIA